MRNLKACLFILFMSLPSIAHSTSIELSTQGTNIGIGTTSTKNSLSVRTNLAVGSATYTNTTAPSNGAIIQGNLGVGTNVPQQTLEVIGAALATSFQTSGTGIGVITGLGGSGIGFDVDNNGTSNHAMTNAGNVGIGSLVPGQTLDVNGTVRATSFSGDGSNLTGVSAGWTTNGTDTYSTTLTNNIGIGTLSPAALLDISSTVNQNLFIVHDNGPTDSTPGLFVNASGNVGIGTTQIGAVSSLTVVDQSDGPGNIRMYTPNTGTNTTAWLIGQTPTSLGVFGVFGTAYTAIASRAARTAVIAQTGSTGVTIDSDGALDIRFASNAVEKMRMISGGNLGIGTVTPVNKLGVSGNAAIGSSYAGISSAPTNGLIVQGNMGIASVAPGSALDIQGTVRFFAATSSITKKSSSNQACDTTCGGSMCIWAQESTSKDNLACTDATADVCGCMGP